MRSWCHLVVGICAVSVLAQAPSPKPALDPKGLYQRLSRSVFIVEGEASLGSGVAVGPELVVTNEHVVADGKTIKVRHGTRTWTATLSVCSPQSDLCLLSVPDLDAPVVPLRRSTIAPGERVYALGAPEGLELTFSEGMISAVRVGPSGQRLIQTSTPISHGSSGGGLFDIQGRLVGITTFYVKDGQSLNFALPAELVSEMVQRLRPPSGQKGGPNKPTVSDFLGNSVQVIQRERAAAWGALMEKFDTDTAVVLYQDIARKIPNDAKAHTDLAYAYTQGCYSGHCRVFRGEDYAAASIEYRRAPRTQTK